MLTLFILIFLLSLFLKKVLNYLFFIIIILFFYFLIMTLNGNREFFYFIFLLSFINDTSAYIIGKTFKGPLIIPDISPKKTWSGTLGSYFIVFIIMIFYTDNFFFILIFGTLFFLGDIYFSFIKRSLNLKDFSNVLGGHGGVLDRLDSIFLPVICYLTFVNF